MAAIIRGKSANPESAEKDVVRYVLLVTVKHGLQTKMEGRTYQYFVLR